MGHITEQVNEGIQAALLAIAKDNPSPIPVKITRLTLVTARQLIRAGLTVVGGAIDPARSARKVFSRGELVAVLVKNEEALAHHAFPPELARRKRQAVIGVQVTYCTATMQHYTAYTYITPEGWITNHEGEMIRWFVLALNTQHELKLRVRHGDDGVFEVRSETA